MARIYKHYKNAQIINKRNIIQSDEYKASQKHRKDECIEEWKADIN